jgi:uncharacterized protein (TIGR02284 family)
MVKTNHEIISALNDLIETLNDGEYGYKTAAEGIEKNEYKSLFNKYSEQRRQFAAELQNEVKRLNGDPKKSGSVSGSLHRGWIDIKSVVTSGDGSAIISECERGEDTAVEVYEEMLDRDLPADIQSIVEKQYTQVKEAHDRMRSLEKAMS